METNENNEKKKKSWIEKNGWWIALIIGTFISQMCKEMARNL